MILLKKTQKKKLSKIQPVAIKTKTIQKPRLRVAKQKIKIKRRSSNADESIPKAVPPKIETQTESSEVVHTQQNFYHEKLDDQKSIENDLNEADEALFDLESKPETGVLFGAAYENKYIDIIENDNVENDMELNERMLEISLGMDKDELRELTKIEIKVDTTNTHMQHVGEVLDSLKILRLNDSVIPSARDLGTSFRNLQVLSINRWELKSLAGLSSFEFIKELYASYNYISDLFDVSYCYHLETLDLEGNEIDTWDNISYMAGCMKLHEVNLEMNPICQDFDYKNRVKQCLPNVKYIDETYRDAIMAAEPEEIESTDVISELDWIDELAYILPKFAGFSQFGLQELENMAKEALKQMGSEDDELMIIKKQVRRPERKNEAFEKETFDIFDDFHDS